MPLVCGCGNKGMKVSQPGQNEGPPAEGADRDWLRVQVHNAQLVRSFSKLGLTDTHVVIAVDGKEVQRTTPAIRWTRKSPQWDTSVNVRAGPANTPETVTFAVYNTNPLGKVVLCGTVTVPICSDMGFVEEKDFALTKNNSPTGTLCLSFQILDDAGGPTTPATPVASLGGELDNMSSWIATPKGSTQQLQLQELEGNAADNLEADDDDENEEKPAPLTLLSGPEDVKPEIVQETQTAPEAQVLATEAPTSQEDDIKAVLCCSWTCVATSGLDEFLKASGVGVFQRKLAMNAKWPGWDFTFKPDGTLHFVNHSALGDLHELISLDGSTYEWKDGRSNVLKCTAQWEKTPQGGALKIKRTGSVGTYSEERRVEGKTLTFTLTNESGVSWGRVFERAGVN